MCAQGKKKWVLCPVPLQSCMVSYCSWVMSKVQENTYVSTADCDPGYCSVDERLQEHRRKEGCDLAIRGSFTVAKRENRKGHPVAQQTELKGQSIACSGKHGPAKSCHVLDYILFQVPSEQGGERRKNKYSVFPIRALIHLCRQHRPPSWQSDPFSLPIKEPLESNYDERLH